MKLLVILLFFPSLLTSSVATKELRAVERRFDVHFDLGKATLNAQEIEILDHARSFLDSLNGHGQKINLYGLFARGWTDSTGSIEKNTVLAERRVSNVRKLLLNQTGELPAIKCEPKAERNDQPTARGNRLVSISVVKHGLWITKDSLGTKNTGKYNFGLKYGQWRHHDAVNERQSITYH
jgi:hypothetical protein